MTLSSPICYLRPPGNAREAFLDRGGQTDAGPHPDQLPPLLGGVGRAVESPVSPPAQTKLCITYCPLATFPSRVG